MISWPELEIVVGAPEKYIVDVFINSKDMLTAWSVKEFFALGTVFLFLCVSVLDLTGLRLTTL